MKKSLLFVALTLSLASGLSACKTRVFDEDEDMANSEPMAGLSPNKPQPPNFFDRDGNKTPFKRSDLGPEKVVGKDGLAGLDYLRPVLKGVLYRGGLGGDKKPHGLTKKQQETLCTKGFTRAYGFLDSGPDLTKGCDEHDFIYTPGSDGNYADFLKSVHKVIKDGKGKVFVHCRWGIHASGLASAVALHQFCGWSEDETIAYWRKNYNGNNPGQSWLDKNWGKYKKAGIKLSITPEEQKEVCPQK